MRRPTLGELVTTLYFALAFLLSVPLGVLLGLAVAAATAPFDPERRTVHAVNCLWMFDYLRLNPFWRVRFEGRERLPQGACVMVANHQSVADIPVLMGLRASFKFVSKESLFQLPFVGWQMRLARYVALERGRLRSMQRMLEHCKEWLARGIGVLVFPEGTYAPKDLLPFHRGAFSLAMASQVPVVPIAILGTRDLIEGDGPWLAPRCDIRVKVLEPILPSEFGEDVTQLAKVARERIARALMQ
jgi:1-acyl-sn-glycerol-3-phosphate acyltransferase